MESFDHASLAVNTQTPVVRMVDGKPKATTGGVVRMLVPLLQQWTQGGRLRSAEWVSMGTTTQDQSMDSGGLHHSLVGLSERERAGYARVKERMWCILNANPGGPDAQLGPAITGENWSDFESYQQRSARALEAASTRMGRADLLYVHDFQQLGVAHAWKGPTTPKVFHLHTPFPSMLPPGWADYFLSHLRRYDAVVVSTARYAQNLRDAGHQGDLRVIHPFIDPSSYHEASAVEIAEFRDRFGIRASDRVILNVARMDPMKGQDRLLDAMPYVLAKCPDARLVLVGNGSFSSSKRGGLGLDKGRTWRAFLEARAQALGIAHAVTFTGHASDQDLMAAYAGCEVFSLPSTREGFGLAPVEAWRHRKPVVVSDRAGMADLIEDRINGIVVDPSCPGSLADALLEILGDPQEGRRMGARGFATSDKATLRAGQRALEGLFESILQESPHAVA